MADEPVDPVLMPSAGDAGSTFPARRSRRLPPLVVVGVLLSIAAIVGEVALYNHASIHAFLGNSDGATVVLEGQSMSAGHLALRGWDLSLDSFWSLDAVFYAVAVGIVGVRASLLTVVPSVIAVAVLAIGVVISVIGRRSSTGRVGAGIVVFAILGLPANILAYFLLQGPWHIGTTLCCLGAFWGLSRGRFDWGVAAAVVLLAAGLLGDTQAALLGIAPVLGASVAAIVRRRDLRAGVPGIAAVGLGIGLALAVRQIARLFGTFSIATGYPRAHAKQLPRNIEHLASWGASLLGHGALPTISMDNAAGHIDLVRDVEIALFCVGVLAALGALVVGLIRGRSASPIDAVGWRLDDLLLFGIIGDCVLFVAITPNDNGNYARYLTASIVYGVILTARMTGRLLDRIPTAARTLGTVALAGLLVLCGFTYARDLRVPGAKQPDVALASFLEAQHLHDGLGDYWSSSITTVESGGRVRVRPVIPDKTHQLVRYGRQSAADWYQGVNFTFLVFNLARPWRGVDAATAAATFGTPSRTDAVGTYRVLVWDTPVHVSTVGYSRK